nr:glycosyltransferase family 2 protein [Paenibacillus sp. ACRRY]
MSVLENLYYLTEWREKVISQNSILISIIMPVYNRQESIACAIESILNQTYSNFELIIIDDGSTDKTCSIISSFSDDRIRYFLLKKNIGAAAARNVGIHRAKGQWIAFQDSDDYWDPSKLRKQVQLIDDRSPSIIFSSFVRNKKGSKEYIPKNQKDIIIPKEGRLNKQLLRGNFIATPTVLMPKVFFEKFGGFNEQMPRFQDWELWLRLSSDCNFIWIDEPLVKVEYTENSISSDRSKMIKGYELIWSLHSRMLMDAGAEYVARYLFSFGHNLSLFGEMKYGREILIQSFRYGFFSLRQLFCLGLNILGHKMYLFLYRFYK